MNRKISLLAIILIGFMVRIAFVGRLPVILNRDEAALAYNALLIAKSGQDEWQRTMPLTFQSFGDYKLPGYIYTLAGLFTVFKPSDFLVRLPSVLAGTGLIFISYLTARRLKLNRPLALIFSLVIALQPVFIFYSRMAWEANLALLLTVWGLNLLFLARQKRSKHQSKVLTVQKSDVVGVLVLALAILTYNSPLIYLPFIMFALLLQRGVKNVHSWLLPVLLLAAVAVGMSLILLPISTQKSGITIFTDATVWSDYVRYRNSLPRWSLSVFGSKYLYWLGLIIQNAINSFSPGFLVMFGGSHPWHNLPGRGHLFWLVYLLGLLGVVGFICQLVADLVTKKKLKTVVNKHKKQLLLIFGLFFSLVPAAITVDAPHATRSLLFFFIFSLLAVIALKKITLVFSQYFQVVVFVFLLIAGVEASLFFSDYFLDYPQEQQMYKPGFDLLVQELEKKFPQKKVAVVADGYQYILAAWYLKLEPEQYFATNIRQQPDKIGLRYGQQVANFHFINKQQDRSSSEEILLYWDEDKSQWQVESFK